MAQMQPHEAVAQQRAELLAALGGSHAYGRKRIGPPRKVNAVMAVEAEPPRDGEKGKAKQSQSVTIQCQTDGCWSQSDHIQRQSPGEFTLMAVLTRS